MGILATLWGGTARADFSPPVHKSIVINTVRWPDAQVKCTPEQDDAPGKTMTLWASDELPSSEQWPLPLLEEQITLDDTPNLKIQAYPGWLAGRTAVCVSSHGGGGGFVTQWYQTGVAAAAMYDTLVGFVSGIAKTYELDELTVFFQGDGSCVERAAGLAIEREGVLTKLKVLGDLALVHGDYCESLLNDARNAWGATTMLGYTVSPGNHCEEKERAWKRLGCFDRLWGHSAWSAAFLNGQLAVEGARNDWVFGSGRSCDILAAQFVDCGAFPDTAYVTTLNEDNVASLVLRGFATSSDYPGNPESLSVIVPDGGDGIYRAYKSAWAGSYAVFDWAEISPDGRYTTSEPFVAGEKPDGWDDRYADSHRSSDMYIFSGITGEALAPQYDSCYLNAIVAADILVYCRNEAMGEIIKQGIQATDPGKRVKLWVGADGHAQSCQNAISWTRFANAYVNNHSCGVVEPYPVDPGPEVYIVGNTSQIETASFSDVMEACDGTTCKSDYLLYDLNGDYIPDGPIARIPVVTEAEAWICATAAREFSQQINVASPNVLLCAGDMIGVDTTYVPDMVLEAVAQKYSAVGFEVSPIIRDRDFPRPEWSAVKAQAFRDRINSGIREVWGFGGLTHGEWFVGSFIVNTACDYPFESFTRKQRIAIWAPACDVHRAYSCGASGLMKRMMTNPLSGTVVAASVSHMDAGWEHQHRAMVEYLSNARVWAASSGSGVSVARVAYEAVRTFISEEPENAKYALSVSAWGSYAVLPRTAGSAVGESPQSRKSWFSVRNVIVSREAEFVLNLSELATELRIIVFDIAGRRVKEVIAGAAEIAAGRAEWDCRDERNRMVPMGMYFVRASVDDAGTTRVTNTKLVVVK